MQVDDLKDSMEIEAKIAALQPDAYLVNSFGRIIPKRLLNLARYPLCVHPSLLPLLRGPSPIRTALLLGMEETGVTVFTMTPEVDAGDIIVSRKEKILPDDDFSTLRCRLASLAVELVREAFELIFRNAVTSIPQDSKKATFTRMIRYEDTFLDFTKTAREVINMIRAFAPDMGAVCQTSDGKKLKILKARAADEEKVVKDVSPGQVIAIGKESFFVACKIGLIEVLEVQPENRRAMSAREYIAGKKLRVGDILGTPIR